jgi:hypothetical protein
MSTLFILSVLIQIAVIIHVIKTGRNTIWVWIIFFFSLLGCFAYFLVEILPQVRGSRTTQAATNQVLKTFEPNRELKQLIENLEISDNVENRVKLAEAYVAEGLYEKGIELYHRALSGIYQDDPHIMLGLANALFHKGDYTETKAMLNHIIEVNPTFKSQEGHLLFARTLEALEEREAALEEYEVLSSYYSGYEAKCRYALLLEQLEQGEKAQELFKEILTRAKQLPRNYRKAQKQWIDIASQHMNSP